MGVNVEIVGDSVYQEHKRQLEEKMKKTKLSEIPWRDYLDWKDYDKSLDSMCTNCRSEQIAKYGEITIQCSGYSKLENRYDEDVIEMFQDSELEMLKDLIDPVHWAKFNIAANIFVERWYQSQLLSCTANRKVVRCGRRAGKSFSIALRAIHNSLMNNDFKTLIVCPAEVQTEEIYEAMTVILNNLDKEKYGSYDDMVASYTKQPVHTMKFKNGSRVKGFTAGTQGAKSVRGQPADDIILDEVDYLTEKDVNSILGILLDTPETTIFMSSTPDGKKNLHKFSKRQEYKEFHFPSFVIPHYSDVLDNELRGSTTDIGYVQEIMAEFGESNAGVFQNFFIDKCIDNNFSEFDRLNVLNDRSRYIMVMGCDWNDDKVGTRIFAIAFDKILKKFFIAEKASVSREGWSQVDAVAKIRDLNRKYVFDHMYVDEGFGVSSIQFMKSYALDIIQTNSLPKDHPDRNLIDVVGVNFSSKIEISDQETGFKISKDTKTYLVENSVRMLERTAFILHEEVDKDLIKQMQNYIVAGRTPSGKPVYRAEQDSIGDHDLDAFMIGLYGFACNYSQFLSSLGQGGIAINVMNRNSEGKFRTDEQAIAEMMEIQDIDGTKLITPDSQPFASRQSAQNMYNNKLSRSKHVSTGRASFGQSSGGARRGFGRSSW